jgi:hypothetical protein
VHKTLALLKFDFSYPLELSSTPGAEFVLKEISKSNFIYIYIYIYMVCEYFIWNVLKSLERREFHMKKEKEKKEVKLAFIRLNSHQIIAL